jgi:hypothetical protein
MAIKVNGTEVVSNARALSNITSIDATTAAAIEAGGIGGGGTVDFTASGSLSNGDLVKLNSDGTVSVIQGGGLGTPVVFESANTDYPSATFDSNSNKVVIAYRDRDNSFYGTAVVGTVSGTSISFGTPVVFESTSTSDTLATFDSSSSRVVIVYRDNDNSGYGTAVAFGVKDVENWVGFASASVSDGSTATINVVSSVNEGQTGLTTGAKYYLPDSGTLSTTPIDGREVGRAIAADKILVTQGSISV